MRFSGGGQAHPTNKRDGIPPSSKRLVSPSFVCAHPHGCKSDASQKVATQHFEPIFVQLNLVFRQVFPKKIPHQTRFLAGTPQYRCCRMPRDVRSPVSHAAWNDTSRTNK